MSVKFSFEYIENKWEKIYPATIEDVHTETYIEDMFPDGAFREVLLSMGGEEYNEYIRFNYGEHESISLSLSKNGAVISPRADYKYIIDFYDALCQIESNCCIFDLQTGIYHDRDSFIKEYEINGI